MLLALIVLAVAGGAARRSLGARRERRLEATDQLRLSRRAAEEDSGG